MTIQLNEKNGGKILVVHVKPHGDPDGVPIMAQPNLDTNWVNRDSLPELAKVPDGWQDNATPGYYFRPVASVSLTLGFFGYMMRIFRRLDMPDPVGGGE